MITTGRIRAILLNTKNHIPVLAVTSVRLFHWEGNRSLGPPRGWASFLGKRCLRHQDSMSFPSQVCPLLEQKQMALTFVETEANILKFSCRNFLTHNSNGEWIIVGKKSEILPVFKTTRLLNNFSTLPFHFGTRLDKPNTCDLYCSNSSISYSLPLVGVRVVVSNNFYIESIFK